MKENNVEICCTYRTWLNYLSLAVCIPVYVMLFMLMMDSEVPAWMVVILIYIAMYNILRICNKKIILCDNILITYGVLRKRREYNVCDITKIVVTHMSYQKSIAIYFGTFFFIVRKDISNYDEFVKALCDKMQLKGYTRGGVSEFVLK